MRTCAALRRAGRAAAPSCRPAALWLPGVALFVAANGVVVPQDQRDVVEAVEQPLAGARVEVERRLEAGCARWLYRGLVRRRKLRAGAAQVRIGSTSPRRQIALSCDLSDPEGVLDPSHARTESRAAAAQVLIGSTSPRRPLAPSGGLSDIQADPCFHEGL